MYTVNGKQYNEDSDINWEIKKEVVHKEVYACVSDFVTMLQEANIDDYFDFLDEFENIHYEACPNCFEPVKEIDLDDDEERDAFLDYVRSIEGRGFAEDDLDEYAEEYRKCDCCDDYIPIDNVEQGRREVYEYWIVSDRLGIFLRMEGEPVLQRMGDAIWGRRDSGQLIALDDVIEKICLRSGWLEGQAYSWEHSVR